MSRFARYTLCNLNSCCTGKITLLVVWSCIVVLLSFRNGMCTVLVRTLDRSRLLNFPYSRLRFLESPSRCVFRLLNQSSDVRNIPIYIKLHTRTERRANGESWRSVGILTFILQRVEMRRTGGRDKRETLILTGEHESGGLVLVASEGKRGIDSDGRLGRKVYNP